MKVEPERWYYWADKQGCNPLDVGLGQVMDAYCYGTTQCIIPSKERASVIGEYGYAKFLDAAASYRPLVRSPGISGLVVVA